ncbi:MAG: hypothetical protein M1814_004926 [Vezdaea aestivalis]|nr:MAG: hypothetical protein M1814_004926 [Vezdaea aestivalis]
MEAQLYNQHSEEQGPFFFFGPEANMECQKHGHFPQYPGSESDSPLMSLSRPSSSSSQVQAQQQAFQSALTPMVSPQPFGHKPTILVQDHTPHLLSLDTDCVGSDIFAFPSTPPLSTSGSAINSPPSSCGLLPTPVNGLAMMYPLDILESSKDECHGGMHFENLAGGDWSRSDSPPMTPVFVHPPSVTASQASEHMTACPSLSPSPSPQQTNSTSSARSIDFCDPRALTVSEPDTINSSLAVDFPPLPTLCTGDDEEHKYILGGAQFQTKPAAEPTLKTEFDFSANCPLSGLPSFDHFSDLDSDDDFVNNLVNFPATDNVQYLGNKRQRTDLLTFDESSFLSEDEFEDFHQDAPFTAMGLETHPDSIVVCQSHSHEMSDSFRPKKRQQTRKTRKAAETTLTEAGEASDIQVEETPATQAQDEEETAAENTGNSSDGAAVTSGSDGAPPTPAPVARRGRKQSLTDDPSKTFVCHLCSRRFRRQEHLKRHYRSLHTHDKPFECTECGKTFSRSDNLSQHARTHGSGAIVMGVLEDGELPPNDDINWSQDRIARVGSMLRQIAENVGSESSDTPSEGEGLGSADASPTPPDNKERKRKRDE